MRIIFLIMIFTLALAGCGRPKQLHEMDPVQFHNSCEEEFTHKFIPDTYRPANFDVGQQDKDLDQKRQELSKLKEYNIISDQEFEEKLKQFDLDF